MKTSQIKVIGEVGSEELQINIRRNLRECACSRDNTQVRRHKGTLKFLKAQALHITFDDS
jgi:hypothetical protein